ncbi:phage virion morphogenesis protein, partial [Sansalvadorimonas verongulae]|uniref:phage virion morphogenesis protein n=1 Tax=Sansalvadorimonas verongulae TaxID=2172824 RepID=UPI0018AD0FD7
MLSIDEAQKNIQRLMDTVSLYQYRKPLFQRLGRALVSDAKMNFVNERGPDGTPWDALKIREGRILSDTGRLKNSLTYAVG